MQDLPQFRDRLLVLLLMLSLHGVAVGIMTEWALYFVCTWFYVLAKKAPHIK
jgi:hypothetical protein